MWVKWNYSSCLFQRSFSWFYAHQSYCNFLTGFWTSHKGILVLISLLSSVSMWEQGWNFLFYHLADVTSPRIANYYPFILEELFWWKFLRSISINTKYLTHRFKNVAANFLTLLYGNAGIHILFPWNWASLSVFEVIKYTQNKTKAELII